MATAFNVATKAQGAVADIKGKLSGQGPLNVNWNEYNYPPCLKILHYDINELESDLELKKLVRFMWLTHIAVGVLTIFNFVSTIIQGASIDGQWIRLLYTTVWFMLINPIQTLWFYTGYKGLVDTNSYVLGCGRFKIGGFVLCLLYMVQSIVNVTCWNGWVRVARVFDGGYGGIGIMLLVENILIYLLIAFMMFIMWKAHFKVAF